MSNKWEWMKKDETSTFTWYIIAVMFILMFVGFTYFAMRSAAAGQKEYDMSQLQLMVQRCAEQGMKTILIGADFETNRIDYTCAAYEDLSPLVKGSMVVGGA